MQKCNSEMPPAGPPSKRDHLPRKVGALSHLLSYGIPCDVAAVWLWLKPHNTTRSATVKQCRILEKAKSMIFVAFSRSCRTVAPEVSHATKVRQSSTKKARKVRSICRTTVALKNAPKTSPNFQLGRPKTGGVWTLEFAAANGGNAGPPGVGLLWRSTSLASSWPFSVSK